MKVQLTADLPSFLLAHNYRYCLSKTTLATDADHVTITLTPTLKQPRTRNLLDACDTYFNLKREPAQMAKGLDEDTTVWVELNTTMAAAYLKDVLKPVLNSGQGIIKLHLVS
ncbi:hypothetical protein ACFJIV_05855 [Mucilaginibacter sp. UC70_90]